MTSKYGTPYFSNYNNTRLVGTGSGAWAEVM